MHVPARFTKGIAALSTVVATVLVPGLALAAQEVAKGPTRKEILMYMLVAVLGTAVSIYLYRVLYGLFLDWNWGLDFAAGLARTILFLGCLTIWLAVVWHLWPQSWSSVGWWVLGALWALMLILSLIGHSRRA